MQIFCWQCYAKEQRSTRSLNLKKMQDFLTGKESSGTEDNAFFLIMFKILYHINVDREIKKIYLKKRV